MVAPSRSKYILHFANDTGRSWSDLRWFSDEQIRDASAATWMRKMEFEWLISSLVCYISQYPLRVNIHPSKFNFHQSEPLNICRIDFFLYMDSTRPPSSILAHHPNVAPHYKISLEPHLHFMYPWIQVFFSFPFYVVTWIVTLVTLANHIFKY